MDREFYIDSNYICIVENESILIYLFLTFYANDSTLSFLMEI